MNILILILRIFFVGIFLAALAWVVACEVSIFLRSRN